MRPASLSSAHVPFWETIIIRKRLSWRTSSAALGNRIWQPNGDSEFLVTSSARAYARHLFKLLERVSAKTSSIPQQDRGKLIKFPVNEKKSA